MSMKYSKKTIILFFVFFYLRTNLLFIGKQQAFSCFNTGLINLHTKGSYDRNF